MYKMFFAFYTHWQVDKGQEKGTLRVYWTQFSLFLQGPPCLNSSPSSSVGGINGSFYRVQRDGCLMT